MMKRTKHSLISAGSFGWHVRLWILPIVFGISLMQSAGGAEASAWSERMDLRLPDSEISREQVRKILNELFDLDREFARMQGKPFPRFRPQDLSGDAGNVAYRVRRANARALNDDFVAGLSRFSRDRRYMQTNIAGTTGFLTGTYDEIYHGLSEADRQRFEDVLYELLLLADDSYRNAFYRNSIGSNYNMQVAVSCLRLSILMADAHPELARKVFEEALTSIALSCLGFRPEGAWQEGVSYWQVSTYYMITALEVLQSAFGHTFGFSDLPGLKTTGLYGLHVFGPTGLPFNYADASFSSGGIKGENGTMNRMATLFDQPLYAWSDEWIHPAHGWDPEVAARVPLDYHARGRADSFHLLFMREDWQDPDALYAAIGLVPSRHFDLGSFDIHALGHVWTVDFGYGRWVLRGENLNTSRQYGYYHTHNPNFGRFYNQSSRSHQVPLLNNRNQARGVSGEVLAFERGPRSAFTLVDLSAAYPDADHMRRGMRMLEGRKALMIQDEYQFSSAQHVTWGLSVDAEVEVEEDGKQVLLRKGDKQMRLILVSGPADARFSFRKPEVGKDFVIEDIAEWEQNIVEEFRPDFHRVLVELPNRKGDVRITILAVPDGVEVSEIKVMPLRSWSLEAAVGFSRHQESR